jgi:hypothetical protein
MSGAYNKTYGHEPSRVSGSNLASRGFKYSKMSNKRVVCLRTAAAPSPQLNVGVGLAVGILDQDDVGKEETRVESAVLAPAFEAKRPCGPLINIILPKPEPSTFP